MVTKAHQVVTRWLKDEMTMGIRYHAYLITTGSATIEHREPYYAV